jgi:hypothetical protein
MMELSDFLIKGKKTAFAILIQLMLFCSLSVAQTVEINAIPDSGSPPLQVQFDATVVDLNSPPFTYVWSFGDGHQTLMPNPTHNYTVAGDYLAEVTVTNSVSDSISANTLISVSDRLPKTGQSTCFDAAGSAINCSNTAQDGDKQAGVVWPDNRFLNNGDGTLTDQLTGLMWLQDGNCIHSQYPAFDDIDAQDGKVSWPKLLEFVAGVNDDTYVNCSAGYADWRLPNINELESLNHAENYNDWLTGFGFINAPDSSYSSTSSHGDPSSKLFLNFYSGAVSTCSYCTSPLMMVRSTASVPTAPAQVFRTGQTSCHDINGQSISCAGSGQDAEHLAGASWPTPRFVDNGDSSVTDLLTGLMWIKDANCLDFTAEGSLRSWTEALASIATINSGTIETCDVVHNDWRLPNRKELYSLFDYSRHNPAIPSSNPFISVQLSSYWSSTTYAGSTDRAWMVDMRGGVTSHDTKTRAAYVWPVRGGMARGEGTLGYSPDRQDFSEVAVGSSSTQTITIENSGSAAVSITDYGFVNSTPVFSFDFSAGYDPCTMTSGNPFILNASESCTFSVTFSPATAGEVTNTLRIQTDNSLVANFDLHVTGQGVGANPQISVSTGILEFPSLVVNNPAAEAAVIVNNLGAQDLIISSLSIVGGNSVFTLADSNPDTPITVMLNQSPSQEIAVTANCSARGEYTAQLVIGSNDPVDATVSVDLSIQCLSDEEEYGDLSFSASTHDFGEVQLGSTDSQMFLVTNTGNAIIEIVDYGFTTNTLIFGHDFSAGNNPCNNSYFAEFSLAAGESCSFSVSFSPLAAEAAANILQLRTTGGLSSEYNLRVEGQGVSFQPDLSTDRDLINFGSLIVENSDRKAIYIENAGLQDLVISSYSIEQDGHSVFSVPINTPITIPHETLFPVAISVSASCLEGIGSYTGTLLINSNDGENPETRIPLQIECVADEGSSGDLFLAASNTNFGNVDVGKDSRPAEVYMINASNDEQLHLYNLTMSNSNDFRIDFDPAGVTACGEMPVVIQPGKQCIVGVIFNPSTGGNITGELRIESSYHQPVSVIQFTGTGLRVKDSGSDDSLCFIATAAYGTYMADDVVVLRDFRDEFLKPYALGRWFVELYYEVSPPIARVIGEHSWMRTGVRGILSPLVYLIQHPFLAYGLLFSIVLLCIGMIYKRSGTSAKIV